MNRRYLEQDETIFNLIYLSLSATIHIVTDRQTDRRTDNRTVPIADHPALQQYGRLIKLLIINLTAL